MIVSFYLVVSRSLLQSKLEFQNYAERFDLLLYLEECQMHVDIKRYNKDKVTLVRDKCDKRLMVLNVSQTDTIFVKAFQESERKT